MNLTEIKQLAWVGDSIVRGPIKGLVVSFHGLGSTGMKEGAWGEETKFGEAGYLTVFPYYGPWSWMNRQARDFVDQLVEAVYREYKIPQDAPLISHGGSMGGCSALIFTRYAKSRPVTRCCAIFPVCDLPFHYTERADLPRTMRVAFAGYPEPFEDVLKEHSPLHQVEKMPDIPYYVLHGDADQAVNKAKHSDRFVAGMRKRGLNVMYQEIPGYGHGGPLAPEIEEARAKFVTGR